jgi:ABC-2 type transport system ATP-binding protein
MNLMAGLVRPSAGQLRLCGVSAEEPDRLNRLLGYSTQVDSFPAHMTGLEFVSAYQRLAGASREDAAERARKALERTGMTRVAHRKVAGYSKGMRQRIKLAQAIAKEPSILLLDEPLNGLDPLARSEFMELFRVLAREGLHLVVSSHIMHEVDALADHLVVLHQGYVVAEGGIGEVRAEIDRRPLQMTILCDRPKELAAHVLMEGNVTEVRITDGAEGFVVRTRDAARMYALLQRAVVERGHVVRSATTTDDDSRAVYQYLLSGSPEAE